MTLSDRDYMAISPHESQILTLLDIDEVDQIYRRVESLHSGLSSSLKDLYKGRSEYDCILFESHGKLRIMPPLIFHELPFELAKIYPTPEDHSFGSHLRKGFRIQTVNTDWRNLSEERPPFTFMRPSLWRIYNRGADPSDEKSNQSGINFGRFFHRCELILDSEYDPDHSISENRYRPASAFGYRLL